MGHVLLLKEQPQRIISLVPSQTELLYDLGLRDEIVGITKFCVHPDELFRSRQRVGGTKKIDFEKIRNLQPDLIIGNKEENERTQILELMHNYPVWMSDVKNLTDASEMIQAVGELVSKKDPALVMADQIKNEFNRLKSELQYHKPRIQRVAYFIWKNPYMTVAKDTFINHMLETCGFRNVFSESPDSRYPQVSVHQIQTADPELILLSSEPYPFKEKDVEVFKSICPAATVLIADGELFSWYGSRLLQAPRYFLQLLEKINQKDK